MAASASSTIASRRSAPAGLPKSGRVRRPHRSERATSLQMSFIYEVQGKHDDEVAVLRKWVAARPDDPAAQAGLAAGLMAAGKFDEAADAARNATAMADAGSALRIALTFGRRAGRASRLLDHHLVDEAVLLCFTRTHEVVAIGILLDALEGLPGVLHYDLIQLSLQVQDFLSV